jgi:hypothetical protein
MRFAVSMKHVMTWFPITLLLLRSRPITLVWVIIVLMIGCLAVWQRWIDTGKWLEWDERTMRNSSMALGV